MSWTATPQENSAAVTEGSGRQSSWMRRAENGPRSTGVNGRKERDRSDSAEVAYTENMQCMNEKFEVVGRAMMEMADSRLGDMMIEMERTSLKTISRDSTRCNHVVEVIIKRRESELSVKRR